MKTLMLFKPAYTLFLKTGTWCNAGCVTCPAGRKLPEDKESGGTMTPDTLERILSYVEKQGRIISATMHYYNEPTANPHMSRLVATCHAHGVHCLMSTNGSYWRGLEPVLNEGLTNLIFSVSGWTQAVHERSHAGVNVDVVKENMRRASALIAARPGDFKGDRQFVRVSWHDYAYNEHEQDAMRAFSESLGFRFTPYDTGLLPLERAQARMTQAMDDPTSPEDVGERDLRTKLVDAWRLCFDRRDQSCDNQFRKLTIDGQGNLHNCCVKAHDANRRGSLFDTNLEEFNRFRMEQDEDCRKCKELGHHKYAEQSYRIPLGIKTTVKRALGDLWKRHNCGGAMPWVSAKYSQWAYPRPKR